MLLGCSRPTVLMPDPEGSKPSKNANLEVEDAAKSPVTCLVPSSPKGLVLAIERTIMPIKAPFRREAAEVTAHGACTATVECATISDGDMDRLWKLFERASRVRLVTAPTSPHYGSRTISARWVGGTCEVSDGHGTQVLREDEDIFYASFDGIVAAVIARRPDAGKP